MRRVKIGWVRPTIYGALSERGDRAMRPMRLFKETVEWGNVIWHVLGWFGLTSLITGLVVAIGGAVWAVLIGVPFPIAVMAGFCTFVGAIYLTIAPIAYRVLAKAPAAQARKSEPPNYAAVRLQHEYELGPASRLWCDVDPNETPTYDSKAWLETFQSAIKTGKLEFVPKDTYPASRIDSERNNPDRNTVVTRDALKKYAKSINQNPKFLRDS